MRVFEDDGTGFIELDRDRIIYLHPQPTDDASIEICGDWRVMQRYPNTRTVEISWYNHGSDWIRLTVERRVPGMPYYPVPKPPDLSVLKGD